jgi:hypothetical protein
VHFSFESQQEVARVRPAAPFQYSSIPKFQIWFASDLFFVELLDKA